MKQLALEFNRTKENEMQLLSLGFVIEEDYGKTFVYRKRQSKISVYDDNSIYPIIDHDKPLSIVLNLIEMGLFIVYEE